MKKIGKLLKDKRWRCTAGGVMCLMVAAMIFALGSGVGASAESIDLGYSVSIELDQDQSGAYLIKTEDQLKKIGNATEGTQNNTFRLDSDIDISVTSPATGTFEGTFDGNGHVITVGEVNIDNSTAGEVTHGLLFGTVADTGTVTNVIVDFAEGVNYERTSSGYLSSELAGPVAYAASEKDKNKTESSSVIQTYASETIDGVSYKVQTFNEYAKAIKTYTVESGTDYFGLLCGENQGTISKVYVTGSGSSITAKATDTGLATTYEQAGTADVKYYYKENVTTGNESVTGTVRLPGSVLEGISTETVDFGTEKNIGVSGSLKVTPDETGTFTYELTLNNSNTDKIITISTESLGTDWTKDEESVGEIIVIPVKNNDANGSVVLKKTVTKENNESNTEDLTITASISTTTYSYEFFKSEVVENTFDADDDSNETVVSGSLTENKNNTLYAGGITGLNRGTISEVKQSINLSSGNTGTEEEQPKIGGIVGSVAGASSSIRDIHMLGKVNNNAGRVDGLGEVSLGSDSSIDGAKVTSALNDNWKTYVKSTEMSDGETTQVIFENLADLKWLVNPIELSGDYFTYDGPGENKLTAKLDPSVKQTSKGTLSYAIAYDARKSMDEETEATVYLSNESEIDLGNSGYYRIKNAYATDGYYHYSQVLDDTTPYQYPYNTDHTVNPAVVSATIDRLKGDPITDVVSVTAPSGADTLYYVLNDPDTIPTSNSENQSFTLGSTLQLNFEYPSVDYQFVCVLYGKIYPIQRVSFDQYDKATLPEPLISRYNYYDASANLKDYVTVTAEDTHIYEKGTDIIITPNDATSHHGNYHFRYQFSVQDTWDEDNAVEYEDSAVISLTGENVYLLVEVNHKNYNKQVVAYGPFEVVDALEIETHITDFSITEGDTVDLYCNNLPNGASIEYCIKEKYTEEFNEDDWIAYGSPIAMSKPNGYLYARINYGNGSYGLPKLFDYSFGDVCDAPVPTPTTGVSSDGADAAAIISPETMVTLSSRTPDAQLFYMTSDSSNSFNAIRVPEKPGGAEEGIPYNGKLYFEIANRWYEINNTNVKKYDSAKGIELTHKSGETLIKHVIALAIAPGFEPSDSVSYVYKVRPAQKVNHPEAAIETKYTPGGETIEVAKVTKDATISFYSTTPQATLYYAIGSNNDDFEMIPETGIPVSGKYNENFVVRIKAEKLGMLPSDIVTFTYLISEQERTNAPVATPGTSDEAPTTVIPGNKILLSSPTKGAVIFYTENGMTPQFEENENGDLKELEGTIKYNPNEGITMDKEGKEFFTITAIAVKKGLAPSESVHFIYAYPGAVLMPYTNIPEGKVELNTKVILKNLTEGADIYYTVAYGESTPKEPDFSSPVFNEDYPIEITQKTSIKAMAAKDGIKSEIASFVFDPMAKLAAPKASIESGSVVSKGTVLELTAEAGADVFYTMDGSDPLDPENTAVLSGKTILLNGESGGQITIKAYARANDKSTSEVATFTYLFSQNTGGITASIENGSVVANGTKVNLMTDVTGGEIYYTTDGSSPIEEGKKGTTVEIDGIPGSSFSIRAVVMINGEPGPMASFVYRIKEKPTEPIASPAGGTLTVATRVSLSSSAEEIYYTTDGSEPTKSSALYTEEILINRTTTLKAIAVSEDGEISDVATFQYTVAAKAAEVTSSKPDGTILEPGDPIQLRTATDGAVIYYSTDGTVPTVDNLDSLLVYNGESIDISRSVTIQAVAFREDLRLSNVVTWNYIVETIPAVEQKKAEAEKMAEEGLRDTDASALKVSEEQPIIKTVRENEFKTAVCYTTDAQFPNRIKLVTAMEENNPYITKKAKGIFGDDTTVLQSYEIKVKESTRSIQPRDDVEVAFQIPKGYEDAVLSVALVGKDNNLTTLETRREANTLYATVNKLGSYVIIGPEKETESENSFPYLLILEIVAGIAVFFGLGFYIREKIKKYRKNK